jgi:hypothetical protein
MPWLSEIKEYQTLQATISNIKKQISKLAEHDSEMVPDKAHHPAISHWDERQKVWYPVLRAELKRSSEVLWDSDLDKQMIEMQHQLDGLLLKQESTSETRNNTLTAKVIDISVRLRKLHINRKERTMWEAKETHRCIYGWGPLTGVHYFHWRHGSVEHNEDGGIKVAKPDYRTSDNWFFRQTNRAQKNKRGFVCPKRRRYGATWNVVAYIQQKKWRSTPTIVFMTKDEGDAKKFIERVRRYRERLPLFLQKRVTKNAYDNTQTSCEVITPYPDMPSLVRGETYDASQASVLRNINSGNPSNAAGDTATDVIIDEYGEIPNVFELLSIGLPMLADRTGLLRSGCALVLGTVGKMSGSGGVAKRLWNKADAFSLDKIYIDGAMGVMMDKYGNDNREKVYKIVEKQLAKYEKHHLVSEANEYRQQYPFSIDDLFLESSEDKPWDLTHISLAEDNKDSYRSVYGKFVIKKGQIQFLEQKPNASPDKDHPGHIGWGQWIIHRFPDPRLKQVEIPYVAGVDPIDLISMPGKVPRKKAYRASDIAACIGQAAPIMGSDSVGHIVAEYTGRPQNVKEAYEQIYMGLKYYKAKANIERQKGSLLVNYLAYDMDSPELIATGTGDLTKTPGTQGDEWGYHATPGWWSHMLGDGRRWWIEKWESPMSERFIYESKVVREQNTDLVVAFLAMLQLLNELNAFKAKSQSYGKRVKRFMPSKEIWERNAQGYFVPTAMR